MKLNRIVNCIAVLVVCCSLLWCQKAPAQAVSLYQTVAGAVANYPLLKQRQAEAAQSKSHITTVNGNRLPSLTVMEELTAGTDNSIYEGYFSNSIVPSGPGSSTVVNYKPNPGNVAVSLFKWDFLTFGLYNAQTQEARAAYSVSNAALGSDTYLLSWNVVYAYLDWLKKYRLFLIQGENVQRTQLMLTAIKATVDNGLKPGVDSSTAAAAYAEARITYLQSQDDFMQDGILLSTLTGLATQSSVPDTNYAAASFLAGLPVAAPDSVSVDHPLLDIYVKQYEQQLAQNSALQKQFLPRVGFEGAGWVRSSGISPSGTYPSDVWNGMPYSRNNYLFGVYFNYDLFGIKHRSDQVVEGQFAAEARQEAIRVQEVSLMQLLQQANATYSATRSKLLEIPRQLNAAQLAYTQQLAMYRAGLNTLIDVTNAQYQLLQAEANDILLKDDLLHLLYMRAALGNQSATFIEKFKN